MPHDINGINSGRSSATGDRQVQSLRRDNNSTDASTQATSSGQSDTVSLTDMASRLKSLEQKLATQPDVDQSNVSRIRDAISRGEYKVNPDRVADKMMDFETDF